MHNSIKFLIIALFAVMFSSCQKELDIDYNTVSPLYVIEAYVTNEGTTAKVTMTQNVLSADSSAVVNDAVISVTGNDGSSFLLTSKGNGEYYANERGKIGVTYTLKAKIGSLEARSSSTMQDSVKLDSCVFYQMDMMGNPCYIYEINVKDDGAELRNYYITLYRNGDSYKWNSHQNKGSLNDQLSIQMICFTDNEDASDDTKRKSWIYDGDVITGMITRTDDTSYDYYSSWETSERTNSNPLSNFTVNSGQVVLGVFSAQYRTYFPKKVFKKEETSKR